MGMLIVKCDRCGHIIENDEYTTVINVQDKEHNIGLQLHLCRGCTRQFNEYFMKNRIGYTKDEMQK